MFRCPSKDWDVYCQHSEIPESCVCGADNWNEDKEEWLCVRHPGYCCEQCYKTHQLELKAEAEAEAEYIRWCSDQ